VALRRPPRARPLPLRRRADRRRARPEARRGGRARPVAAPGRRHVAAGLDAPRASLVRRRRRTGPPLPVGDAARDACARMVGRPSR
jgi:hypothetical protein